MATDKFHRENLVNVDDKGRVVLPREVRRSGLYAVEVTDNDEIILRPRVAVDPKAVIDKKTLAILDESIQHLARGSVGKPIDLSGFRDQDAPGEKNSKTKPKKSRLR